MSELRRASDILRREGLRSGTLRLVRAAVARVASGWRRARRPYLREPDAYVGQRPLHKGQPLAAVIIPCYNYGEYLAEAIDSARTQTLKNAEIVVVDDGSTDSATVRLLDDLQNDQMLVVIRQKNAGLSAARNAGIRATDARYICCLDADDRMERTYLEKMVTFLEVRQDAAMAYPLVALFGDEQGIWRTQEIRPRDLLDHNTIPAAAVFRRDVWAAVGGFDETMRIGYEDWEFWLRVASHGFSGIFLEEPLIEHRRHGMTMTHAAKRHHLEIATQIRERHRDVLSVPQHKPIFVHPNEAFNNITRAPEGGVLLGLMRYSPKAIGQIEQAPPKTAVAFRDHVPLSAVLALRERGADVYTWSTGLPRNYFSPWLRWISENGVTVLALEKSN